MMKPTLEELSETLELNKADGKHDRAVYGEVKQINSDQTYQVSLNGSDTTVKCARLSGAKVGDTVMVELLANGYAVVTGTVGGDTDASDAQASANAAVSAAGQAQSAASAASTAAAQAVTKADQASAAASAASSAAATADSKAVQAASAAATADSKADAASSAASRAESSASAASAAATRAEGKADDAAAAASAAQASASNASEYAARALGNLASVESVAETLAWITTHGTMALTQDQQLDPTHVYFIQDNNGDYTVGGTRYSIVTEPDADDLSTYYELSIDQSLNNYVATHLAVDGEGLWLLPDAGGDKVLIATGAGSTYTTAGTYIIGKVNNVDKVLAQFLATGATVGNIDGAHSVIDANGQRFYASDGTTELGSFTSSGVKLGQNTAPHMFVGPSGSGGGIIFYQNDQDAPAVLHYSSSNNGSYYNDAELTVGDLSTLGAMLKLLTNTADMSKGSRILLETRTGTTALNGKEAHLSLGYNGADIYMRVYDDQTSKKAQALLNTSGFTIDNLQGTNYLSLSFPNGDFVTSGNIEDGAGNVLADKVNGSAGSTVGITLGGWKILWGSESVTTNNASGSGTFTAPYYVDKSITFSFSATPYVWAQVQGSVTGSHYVVVTTTSTTGATMRLMASHKNTTTRYLRWFAIGKA